MSGAAGIPALTESMQGVLVGPNYQP